MFTLRVILKMENNSMLKSRPRYQQLFSSADISCYHLTISSPSSISSCTVTEGKDRKLTCASKEDKAYQTLFINTGGKSFLPNPVHCIHMLCLCQGKEIPETWVND